MLAILILAMERQPMRIRTAKIKGSIGFMQSMMPKFLPSRRILAASLPGQNCQLFAVLNDNFALVFQAYQPGLGQFTQLAADGFDC